MGEVQAVVSLPRSVAQWHEGFGVLEDYKWESIMAPKAENGILSHSQWSAWVFSKGTEIIILPRAIFFFKRGEKSTSNSDRILRTAQKWMQGNGVKTKCWWNTETKPTEVWERYGILFRPQQSTSLIAKMHLATNAQWCLRQDGFSPAQCVASVSAVMSDSYQPSRNSPFSR